MKSEREVILQELLTEAHWAIVDLKKELKAVRAQLSAGLPHGEACGCDGCYQERLLRGVRDRQGAEPVTPEKLAAYAESTRERLRRERHDRLD